MIPAKIEPHNHSQFCLKDSVLPNTAIKNANLLNFQVGNVKEKNYYLAMIYAMRT